MAVAENVLTDKQQIVLEMGSRDCKTQQEIANEIGIRRESVARMQARARKRLRASGALSPDERRPFRQMPIPRSIVRFCI